MHASRGIRSLFLLAAASVFVVGSSRSSIREVPPARGTPVVEVSDRDATPAELSTARTYAPAALSPFAAPARLKTRVGTAERAQGVGAPERRTTQPWRGFSPAPLEPDTMALHMIDVGQADAILLEFECAAALIDTGLDYSKNSGAREKFVEYLRWFFNERRPDLNRTLQLVVLSHSHADHANGVRVILGEPDAGFALKVVNAVDNGYDVLGGADEQVLLHSHAERAESISVSAIPWLDGATSDVVDPLSACPDSEVDPQVRVLWGQWADIEGAPTNPNHHSVVVRLDFGDASFLFTGDLQTAYGEEAGGLELMLTDYAADLSVFDVEVLKVAHHVAENGTTDALLRAASPCLAVMGVGDPDRTESGSAGDHAHPREPTMSRLQDDVFGVSGTRRHAAVAVFPAHKSPYHLMDVDRAIYGTAWDGSHVVFAQAAGTYAVETERDPVRHEAGCGE